MTAELSNPFTVSVYADNSPSEATRFSPTNGYADAARQMVRKAFTISIHGVFVCVCVCVCVCCKGGEPSKLGVVKRYLFRVPGIHPCTTDNVICPIQIQHPGQRTY